MYRAQAQLTPAAGTCHPVDFTESSIFETCCFVAVSVASICLPFFVDTLVSPSRLASPSLYLVFPTRLRLPLRQISPLVVKSSHRHARRRPAHLLACLSFQEIPDAAFTLWSLRQTPLDGTFARPWSLYFRPSIRSVGCVKSFAIASHLFDYPRVRALRRRLTLTLLKL